MDESQLNAHLSTKLRHIVYSKRLDTHGERTHMFVPKLSDCTVLQGLGPQATKLNSKNP